MAVEGPGRSRPKARACLHPAIPAGIEAISHPNHAVALVPLPDPERGAALPLPGSDRDAVGAPPAAAEASESRNESDRPGADIAQRDPKQE